MTDIIAATVDTPVAPATAVVVATPVVAAKPAKTAVVKAVAEKKAVVVKPAKVAGSRTPAKVLMAARKRVTFGPSFISGVLGGFQRDLVKIVLLGQAMNVGTKSELSSLSADDLRERVGAAIMDAPDTVPRSAEY